MVFWENTVLHKLLVQAASWVLTKEKGENWLSLIKLGNNGFTENPEDSRIAAWLCQRD